MDLNQDQLQSLYQIPFSGTIGYSKQGEEAFKAGWDAALNSVYSRVQTLVKSGAMKYPLGLYMKPSSIDPDRSVSVMAFGQQNEDEEPLCALAHVTYEVAEQFIRDHAKD